LLLFSFKIIVIIQRNFLVCKQCFVGYAEQREVHHSRQMRRPLVIYKDLGHADIAEANSCWHIRQRLVFR
jgi:hypothetical protein